MSTRSGKRWMSPLVSKRLQLRYLLCLVVGSSLLAMPASGQVAGAEPDLAQGQPCSSKTAAEPVAALRSRAKDGDTAAQQLVSRTRDARRSIGDEGTIRVDSCGQVLVADPMNTDRRRDELDDPPVSWSTDPALPQGQDVFALSSRPGAPFTIYLDFDGETLAGTAWNQQVNDGNPFHLPAYGEADGAEISATEANRIFAAWVTTAAHFSAFDVNVTTRLPEDDRLIRDGDLDEEFGVHVVVTDHENPVAASCNGCGGIAWLDSAGSRQYSPALVFVQDAWTSGSRIGLTASHEVAHTLALGHHSTSDRTYANGDDEWSPIMGVGWGPGQWSNGDFLDAATRQDDLARLDNTLARLDGAGGPSPAVLVEGSTVVGLISRSSEVDEFEIAAPAGPHGYEVVVSTVRHGSLVPRIELLDHQGRPVAGAQAHMRDSVESPYRIAVVEVPGDGREYTITIDGVEADTAAGSRSDYGSLGTYNLLVEKPDLPSLHVSEELQLREGDLLDGELLVTAVGGTRRASPWGYYDWQVEGNVPDTWIGSTWEDPTTLRIHGRLTSPGTFPLTVTLTAPNGRAVRTETSVTVSPKQPVPDPDSGPRFITRPAIKVRSSRPFKMPIRAEGAGPFEWRVSNGALPSGTRVRLGDGEAVLLRGRVRSRGRHKFELTVQDASGEAARRTFKLVVR